MSVVYMGADHRGYLFREPIGSWLKSKDIEVHDYSSLTHDPDDDYIDIAIRVGEGVASSNGYGILLCASGVGMSVAANKVAGIRAGLCGSVKQTMAARRDDNINVLCLAAELHSLEELKEMIETFLETPFCTEERYVRRLRKIQKYETTAFR